MPIYAYKCESCGFAKDVLQKMSDAPLSVCPHCQASSFRKQVTAAGFQLKGSGWYVTDFRGGGNGASAGKPTVSQDAGSAEAVKPSPGAAVPASSEGATTAAPAASSSSGSSSDVSAKSP